MIKFKIGDKIRALDTSTHNITHANSNWSGIVLEVNDYEFTARTLTGTHSSDHVGKTWIGLKFSSFELIETITEEEIKYSKGFDILCEYMEYIPKKEISIVNNKLLEIGL